MVLSAATNENVLVEVPANEKPKVKTNEEVLVEVTANEKPKVKRSMRTVESQSVRNPSPRCRHLLGCPICP